jgi:hypothetical protein
MATEGIVIVQVPRGGAVDRNWAEDLPPSIDSGQVVVDYFVGEPPEAGEVVMSVLSPEALRRDGEQVRDVIGHVPAGGEPPVIIVEAAEFLREDELTAVVDAAGRAHRPVILRVLADV